MSTDVTTTPIQSIVYPSSDGKRMAENTKQARWIMTIASNLMNRFRDNPDVFIAVDNLVYPVEGRPEITTAPDVYVVFGRPRGDRPSYQYWREGHVPLTVVFEILSPSNTSEEMADKLEFYAEHGVEEYYVYNPDTDKLTVYTRGKMTLVRQRPAHNFVSPRLGVRFDLGGDEMVIRYPDGRAFFSLEDASRQLEESSRQLEESSRQLEEYSRQLEESSRQLGRLRELSRKARRGAATPDELAELERLENAE